MSPSTRQPPHSPIGPILAALGLAIVIGAWLLPINLKSVNPVLLKAAGFGTPSLASFGRDLVDTEKIGPATLLLSASKQVDDPRAPALGRALDELTAKEPAMAAWGGWDASLDPVFNLKAATGKSASTPVLSFFVPEKARQSLLTYLSSSGSLGTQAILKTREVPNTGRFIPATQPGGQPLDALVLLTSLLYQSEHLSASLQRELRSLAETANEKKDLGDLEAFYSDLLSLGRRLDWTQLSELLKRTESVKTVSEYAHLARVAPDQFPLIYSAALFTDSSDKVATYLLTYGKSGADDLKLALGDGEGAVRLLIARQVPVNRSTGPGLSSVGEMALLHPQLTLSLKYLGYVLGVFLFLVGLDKMIIPVSRDAGTAGAFVHVKSGALALLFAALLVVASEPFLLKAASPSEYGMQLHIPILISTVSTPASSSPNSHITMDTSTLVSIGIFAILQVGMYLLCVRKISEIDRSDFTPPMKLRLMENEENLFDSGLYVGMMGTAAALVLQVMGVIAPSLLAAYSSNLFGIVCVAFVKIRHVRGYKRSLILQSQTLAPAAGAKPVTATV